MSRLKEDAVSPVIAVVLMVAVTVVLAAAVYTWVGSLGSGQSGPAGTLSVVGDDEDAAYERGVVVVGASAGLEYGDLRVLVGESVFEFVTSAPADGEWAASRDGAYLTGDDAAAAGDVVYVDAPSSTAGGSLRVVQESANQVILTLRLR